MIRNILSFILLLAVIIPGCSGSRAAELYDTAELEEFQNNKYHAVELYQEIIQKYPDSDYAEMSEERLEQLKQK